MMDLHPRVLAIVLPLLATSGCSSSGDDGLDCGDDVACQSCETLCLQPGCDGVTELDPKTVDACTMNCVDSQDAAIAVSEQCEATFSTWVECIAGLECDAYQAFAEGDPSGCATTGLVQMTCPGVSLEFGE